MIRLPLGVKLNDLIDDLRILSWEAAEIFFFYSQKIKDPNYKKNIIKSKNIDDPVTEADLRVNNLIIQRLLKNYPDIQWGIIREEDVKINNGRNEKYEDWMWFLDPLDGTKDFIQGTGNYAMHLALNYKNRPLLGIVLIPEKDELWISNGSKVWCEKRDRSINKFQLSKKSNAKDMTIVISKNHLNKDLMNLINCLNFKRSINMGSIGCKIASILRGESDIYITMSLPGQSAPKDWDFAAPAAILMQAGGAITNYKNQNLIYNQKGYLQRGIIVASSDINKHGNLCLEIERIIKSSGILP